jgi:hypothetical protein
MWLSLGKGCTWRVTVLLLVAGTGSGVVWDRQGEA